MPGDKLTSLGRYYYQLIAVATILEKIFEKKKKKKSSKIDQDNKSWISVFVAFLTVIAKF